MGNAIAVLASAAGPKFVQLVCMQKESQVKYSINLTKKAMPRFDKRLHDEVGRI